MRPAGSTAQSPSALTHPKYRADIDGLRAVAVLSVVAYHAFPRKITGGFIGVDIFFVISGFLISTILFENLERDTFSFAEFYRRRIRRIFPALILVLLVTLAIGWAVLFNDEFQQLSKHVAAGAAFVSNFALWQESGYFANDAAQKPLLHLWSLGVEEQFYIAWPLLVYIGWRLRTNLLVLTLVVAGASFAFNIAWRHVDPVGLFYSPLTRFWELLAGAILAYLTLKGSALVRLQGVASHVASVAGAILILGAGLLLTTEEAFPGWWALLPIVGAALLIAAGPGGIFNRFILRHRVMVWFGLISYPLYLWHWPLLSYLGILYNEPTVTKKLFAVSAAITLAFLTYTLIEKRVRDKRRAPKTTYALVGMIIAVLAVGYSAKLSLIKPRLYRLEISSPGEEWVSIGEHAVEQDPGIYLLSGTLPGTTLFIGDSHIAQYWPRFLKLAKQEAVHTGIFALEGGCAPIPDVFSDKPIRKSCRMIRDRGFALAGGKDITAVVIGGAWNWYFLTSPEHYVLDNGKKVFVAGNFKALALARLKNVLSDIKSEHKRVILLLDNPIGSDFDPRVFLRYERLARMRAFGSSFAPIGTQQLALRQDLTHMADELGVEIIDPVSRLCVDGSCLRSTSVGLPVYSEASHLSARWIVDNADYIDRTLLGD